MADNRHPRRGASVKQMGEAARLRNNGTEYSKEERVSLHQIVHAGDTSGKFSHTPNPYRDPTCTYDPKAQQVLDAAKKRSKD